MGSEAQQDAGRDRRPRVRRDAEAVERGRRQRMLATTAWYCLFGVLLLAVFAALVLALTGLLPSRQTSEVLRVGGIGFAAFGLGVQALLDYLGSSKDGGMFIRFTKTGWRLGAPVWIVGLAAFAGGTLLGR